MSTPNTSLVKWVLEKDLFASYAKVAEYQERDNIAAPVIALDDLAELVEGLRAIRDDVLTVPFGDCDCKNCRYYHLVNRLLTQLEAQGKEGA